MDLILLFPIRRRYIPLYSFIVRPTKDTFFVLVYHKTLTYIRDLIRHGFLLDFSINVCYNAIKEIIYNIS